MKFSGRDLKDVIISRFSNYVSSGKADFFKNVGIDFVFGRRQGPFVWDALTSKRLINCHCNGGVFNLGHAHPKIIETLKESLDELDIGNHHLIREQSSVLAERLSGLKPGDLTCTVFGVGGGEAIDLAIKLARGYPERPGSFRHQADIMATPGMPLQPVTNSIESRSARCPRGSYRSHSMTYPLWKKRLMTTL